MITRIPITTIEQLDLLNQNEIVEGYLDGLNGDPEPGDNRSTSYWHGWRNGAVDGGYREKDDAQADLAQVFIKSGRFKQVKL